MFSVQQISPSSAGSLAVGIIALFFCVFQAGVAFKRPEYKWNAWGAVVSFSVGVYALAVFVQFNSGGGPVNFTAELIQYSCFIVIIHSLYGFTFAYLNLPSRKYHTLAGSFHILLLLLLWTTNLVVAEQFVYRQFQWLVYHYIEPDIGPLGVFYLFYCVLAALWSLRYWFLHHKQAKSEANAFIAGFLIWIILGAHDALVTLGMQSVQFLMEYGFLAFSAAVLVVTLRKYVSLFTIAEQSKAQLQRAHENLEKRVAERTLELTDLNQKMNREIIDRRRAEQALAASESNLRQVIDLIPHFIFAKDRNGRFILANQAVAKVYGTTVDNLTGKSDADFNPNAKQVKQFLAHDQKVMDSGQPHEIAEERITDSAGNTRWLHTLKIPFSITTGNIDAILGVSMDITALKSADQERIALETQLMRAKKMEALGTLAGGVAHDLNNILSGIVSYPELILMDLSEENPLRKPIVTIQKSGERAAIIVQDLLTLARRGVTVSEVVNLNSIIAEQLENPEYEKLRSFHPDIQVQTSFEKPLLNIKGSATHLSKSVMNLISNAAEAMPDGGQILISTENRYIDSPVRGYDQVEEGDYVTVAVADTGIGVSTEDMEKIFEPFYTKKVMGRSGTGLGMAVVWGTVKDHRGYIEVESKKGQGTTFTLYFPVTREAVVSEESELSVEMYMGQGESILVVDDVKVQRELASEMLKKLRYSVYTVSSGETAVDYLKNNSADLVVLDMIMAPGIDGLDTYKQILQLHPGQKAIIASGFSETDRTKAVLSLGAGQYIKKPYTLERIGLAVRKELDTAAA